MKHIIPTLTLTALAAAASAQQAAAPAGLNYNLVSLSRTSTDNTLAVQMALGQSNFIVGLQSANTEDRNGDPVLTAGYVFKNVTQAVDATVFVQQTQWDDSVYGVTLRRALNEVYQGLEISATYATTGSSTTESQIAIGGTCNWGDSARAIELAYNVNKTFSVAVGLVKIESEFPFNNYGTDTVFSVRAGF